MTEILIIYTGGTIGMADDAESGTLKPFNFTQIQDNLPELKRLRYKIDVYAFNEAVDSSEMQPAIWQQIADIILAKYHLYCGFVVLHGSDTMAFTAAALSFMFENLHKPIVLTGSQLPIGQIRTDAKENMLTALEIAAAKDNAGRAMVPEVCVYFDYQLYRGNRVFKYSAESFDAFNSANWPPLAQAGVNLNFYVKYIRSAAASNALVVHKHFSNRVGVLKLYPGIGAEQVSALLNSTADVIVMESFGNGNAPTAPWFLGLLQAATAGGKVIYNISQCRNGAVEMGRYSTSSNLLTLGVVSGKDICFEAAVVKAMHALGMGLTGQALKSYLGTNQRGEMAE